MYMVASIMSTGSQQIFWSNRLTADVNTAAYFGSVAGSGTLQFFHAGAVELAGTTPLTPYTFYVIGMRSKPGSIRDISLNGTIEAVDASSGSNAMTDVSVGVIGLDQTLTAPLSGSIAEIVCYGKALSDDEHTNLVNFYKEKYGIA